MKIISCQPLAIFPRIRRKAATANEIGLLVSFSFTESKGFIHRIYREKILLKLHELTIVTKEVFLVVFEVTNYIKISNYH